MAKCEKRDQPGVIVPARKETVVRRVFKTLGPGTITVSEEMLSRTVTPSRYEPGAIDYVLTLTEREAQVLTRVLEKVNPVNDNGNLARAMYRALREQVGPGLFGIAVGNALQLDSE